MPKLKTAFLITLEYFLPTKNQNIARVILDNKG